ncbi:hypothetical protein AVL63_10860 [Nesterenkonia jeotgali]|uniref:Uncharacterized protein n=1 Tax=Nesterenkonia jeotgali TaxID=317018 RepID=A0A0W8II31_9MICC|nr:hypothetical protein AVL63_10860 [Nesterenkonia jeotgali]
MPTAAAPEIVGVGARSVFSAVLLISGTTGVAAGAAADTVDDAGAPLSGRSAGAEALSAEWLSAEWLSGAVVSSGGGAEAPIRVAANTVVVRTEVKVRQCWEAPMAFVSSVRRPLRGTGR